MKNLILKIAVTTLLISSAVASAAIYEAKRSFQAADEILYSNWVKDRVPQDIFSNPQSPYYGIKTDCADAAIALRAIYAYENQLSFQFVENEGSLITEKTTRFDNISNQSIERLKAFIAFIGENVGSEVLAKDNTYPIELKGIRPGDLYITRWQNAKGQLTRHVYIIKDILPTGDLLLFSSTTPRAVRPFLPRKGMPLRIFKERPFGFRRFQAKLNGNVAKEQLENYSNMQYEALKLGEDKFFKLVKETLQNTADTLELNIQRRIENVCVALTTRVDVVEMALEAKLDLGKRCFSKDQYDEYSSPSRDRNIIQDIERLRYGYKTIVKNGMSVDLDPTTKLGLDYLIGENESTEALEAIKGLCSVGIDISLDRRVIMNISSFYKRYNAALVSSNPNDHLEARWGLERSKGICPNR
jgi:hypothetical protein